MGVELRTLAGLAGAVQAGNRLVWRSISLSGGARLCRAHFRAQRGERSERLSQPARCSLRSRRLRRQTGLDGVSPHRNWPDHPPAQVVTPSLQRLHVTDKVHDLGAARFKWVSERSQHPWRSAGGAEFYDLAAVSCCARFPLTLFLSLRERGTRAGPPNLPPPDCRRLHGFPLN
jgi:hypothetical protein